MTPDPYQLFQTWFQNAQQQGGREYAETMILSTVDENHRPSSRCLLFKGLEEGGFRFFTNYQSRKAQHLKGNHAASLLFYWPEQKRQVRIEGNVEKLSLQASSDYFQTRDRGSQIGAWASVQSRPIPNDEYLFQEVARYEKEFEGKQVPCPPWWGGYKLLPHYMEFWTGRENRLHKRHAFSLSGGKWEERMLSP